MKIPDKLNKLIEKRELLWDIQFDFEHKYSWEFRRKIDRSISKVSEDIDKEIKQLEEKYRKCH